MANGTVRNLGGSGYTGGVIGKRMVFNAADGSILTVLFDNNKSGVTGAHGDNTNVGKIYLLRSTNGGVSWTQKAVISTALTSGQLCSMSATMDSSENVHVVWRDGASTGSVKYVKATFSSGYNYAFGSATTVYTMTSNYQSFRVDIDCFDNGQAMIAVWTQNSNTGQQGVRAYAIALNAAGAPIYTKFYQMATGLLVQAYSDDITISCTHDPIVGNQGTWVLIATRQITGNDVGDNLMWGIVNVSTGAEILFQALPTTVLPQAGKTFRQYYLFCVDGAREMMYAVLSSGQGAVMGYRRFTLGTSLTWESDSQIGSSPHSALPDSPDSVLGAQGKTCQFDGLTQGTLTFAYTFNAHRFVATVSINVNTGIARSQTLYLDPYEYAGSINPNPGTLNNIGTVASAGNRNFDTNFVIPFLIMKTGPGFIAQCAFPNLPGAPANLTPAAGSTVQTSLPKVGLDFREPYFSPTGLVVGYYKFARDSGFTSSVRAFKNTVGYFPTGVQPPNPAKVTDSLQLSDISNELFTGLWYYTAYELDEWGRFSSQAQVQSFTVSHPPAATAFAPSGGAYEIYGAGNAVLTWTFTDPYVNDFQHAFQVQIQDGTGTIFYDSGKVISAIGGASVPVASGYKDQDLFWRVALWDKDDNEGAFSEWQAFILSDAPAPVVTNPTPSEVFSTGIPTITWTTGINPPKSQVSYLVNIIDSSNGDIVYTSGTVISTDVAFTIPTGVLLNNKNYLVTVTLFDTLGLGGTSSPVLFSTAWTPPLAADLVRAYLYRYSTDGYVFIGWTNVNIDSRFNSWNVYRRQLGEATWTLIDTQANSDTSYGFRDYNISAGMIYQYAVSQVVNESGDLLESDINVGVQVTVPVASYWLIDPLGVLIAVPLFNVTADKFTIEQDTATFNIIGVGRHVDEGDILGANGALTVELWDQQSVLTASTNYFLNSSFQVQTVLGSPDNWNIGGIGTFGNLSNSLVTYFEPSPNGYLNNFIIRSDGMGGTGSDAITLEQDISNDRLPTTPGHTFSHSEWFAVEQVAGNVTAFPNVTSVVQYYDNTNTLISTETVACTVAATFEPSGSGDLYTGDWQRYKATHNMPVGTDHMKVTTQVSAPSAGLYGIVTGGAQIERTITSYFDGGVRGADWLGAPYTSPSVTTGNYTASEQRADIQEIKNIGRPVYLKTPFGQSIYVKLMDNDFDRLAGVTAEFGTMNLPYIEVAF